MHVAVFEQVRRQKGLHGAGQRPFRKGDVAQGWVDFFVWKLQAHAFGTPGGKEALSPDGGVRDDARRGAGARQGGARHDDDRQAGKRLFERAACVHAGGKGRVRAAERELERTGGVFHRAAPAQALDDAQKHVNPQRQKDQQKRRDVKVDHTVFDEQPLRRKDRPNRHEYTGKRKAQKEKGKPGPQKGARAFHAKRRRDDRHRQ